jgi:hypothetical protein
MPARSQLEDTAHHEAAHAVIAHYLGVRIKHVTIVAQADSRGHVAHHSPLGRRLGVEGGQLVDSPRARERAEDEIMVCLAGPLASRKFGSRSWRATGSSDFEIERAIFHQLAGEDVKYNALYSRLLWRRAELLVERRWKEIRTVASVLMEKSTISHDVLRATIGKALGLKPLQPETIAKLRAAAKAPRHAAN